MDSSKNLVANICLIGLVICVNAVYPIYDPLELATLDATPAPISENNLLGSVAPDSAPAPIPKNDILGPTTPISATGPAPKDDFLGPAAPDSTPELDSRSHRSTQGSNSHGVFVVTKYGAVADGKTENKLAFQAAWDDACRYAGDSTFLVPEGTYFVGPIYFNGPCHKKKSPNIEIRGTLKAPTRLSAFHTPTWIEFKGLYNMNLTGVGTGTLDGQGKSSWGHVGCRISGRCNSYPHSVRFTEILGGIISDITLLNSKSFHASFLRSHNILVRGINIMAPGNSPNTDGIHLSDSSNIHITSSRIGVGDDCISIGPGNTNIGISNVNCGPGHGISVGSLGKYPNEKDVVGLSVKNCTIRGTDNGVRVKTWPGLRASKASNMTFEDIVMIDVKNPIIIDQGYCPGHSCKFKTSLVGISDVHFKNIRGTSTSKSAVTLECSSMVPCENIELVDIDLAYVDKDGTDEDGNATSICMNARGAAYGKQNPSSCFSRQTKAPAPEDILD